MLSFFRSTHLLLGVLLIFYVLLLHAGALVLPLARDIPTMGILDAVTRPYFTHSWLSVVLPVLFVFALALLANAYVAENRLISISNLFAGVFTVLAGSAIPTFLVYHPIQVANIFLLLALLQLPRIYRLNSAADYIFNVGFFVGIASLFVASYNWFLLFALGGLLSFRAARVHEILTVLVGWLVPHIMAGFYYFWIDQYEVYTLYQWWQPFAWLDFAVLDGYGWLQLGFMLLLLIVVTLGYPYYHSKMTVESSKKVDLLYWIMLSAALSLLGQAAVDLAYWQTLVIPMGILLSINFSYAKSRTAEAVHLVLLAIVIFIQYYPLMAGWQ